MSDWGKTETITIEREIEVDKNVADKIKWLNEQGVETVASCSGHGKTKPSALIKPSSKQKATELGFDPEYRDGLFKILL